MLKHNQTAAVSEQINKKKLRAGLLLPDDLIVEILSWLPPKCAGRCKVVCKLWQAIIQSRHFIEQHMQRQDYIVVYPPTRLSPPLPVWPPDQQPFEYLFYLRGLLLERNMIRKRSYRIRNYGTNQVFELPDLIECLISGSMCYLPTSDDYKVSILHWKENDTDIDLKVLTKGTDVTWRCIEIPALLSCSKNNGDKVSSITIGSVSYITKSSQSGLKMMAFQIEDERFVEISLPWRVRFCAIGSLFFPMSWDRDFCIGRMVGEELHIWVLQDYKTSKWDERKIAFPSEVYPRLIPHCIFSGEVLVLIVPPITRMLQVDYNMKTKTAHTTRIYHTLRPSLVSL
ncbi:hypothetical protein LIER_32867 [Lithospermum erythrorhizon]|uniref:F-box domain-containing protein n=1 Tax=Lithospermum erythrorhizon TaxID=34254 RepID=A0AAV3RXB7_LITER